MSSRARLNGGIAGGFFLLLLMGMLIGGLATVFNEPEAHAASPGGVPICVSFNPNPARVGQTCQLCVKLDDPFFVDVVVDLFFPAGPNPDMGNPARQQLATYVIPLTVPKGEEGACAPITPINPGWVAVLARANGGRAGGLLEIVP